MYPFRKKPFDHQLKTFEESKHLKDYALFWEQGTGKSKLTIDTACWMLTEGLIDGVLVVAPNNVDANWILDEIPTHCWQDVLKRSCLLRFRSNKARQVGHQNEIKNLLAHKGPTWLAISYDAFMTEAGKKLAWKYLKSRRILYVTDEAHKIKSPSAKRTISIVASGRYATFKRLLTGTPVSNGPFDVYSLMKFLDENFWKSHGLDSYFVFKNRFGIWNKGFNKAVDKEYDVLVGYQNLDKLAEIIKTNSSRVTKDEVLDLPPKLYSKRYFELNSQQEKLYQQIKDEYMAITQSGNLVTAGLAITRLLRFQQITSGYIPVDDEETVKMELIGNQNPRLELLKEICEALPHKAIIWARFQQDIDQIMATLGTEAARYDGKVNDEDRQKAKVGFQTGDIKFLVANPAAASEGLTLHAARTVIYYNNSFSLLLREQSEDRAHRIGQEHPVNYIDLMAQGTVDEHIVDSLRKKKDIATTITGDDLKEWI